MRFCPLYFTALAAQKKGEHLSKSFGGGNGSSAGNDFVIQPANYRRNSYFIDSTFIPYYEPYYAQVPSNAVPVVRPNTIKVFRTTLQPNARRLTAKAYYGDFLPAIPENTQYGQNYRLNTFGIQPGDKFIS